MTTHDHLEPMDVRRARRLRTARLAAGLTVREATSQIGLDDHRMIVRYENGAICPPLDRLQRLATCYGFTVAALLVTDVALMPLVARLEHTDPAVWAAVADVLQET
jgi:transcriptional regulator with XRE-family HTH domain